MKLLRRLRDWLRPKMPMVNVGLALAAYVANSFVDQVFCRPVTWAAWVLGLSTGAFLAWPWLRRGPEWAQYLMLFLQAVLLLVCVYCLWFVGWFALLFGLLTTFNPDYFFTPFLLWVPVLFGVQIVKRLRASALPKAQLVFGAGILLPLLVVSWADYQFRQVETAVAQLPAAQRQDIAALLRVVPRSYMAERLAGTNFKYHNYFCVYDGIRPALHDPLVNVCLWIRGSSDATNGPLNRDVNPLELPFRHLATLYHRLFPDRQLNAGCACTPGYGTITVQVE